MRAASIRNCREPSQVLAVNNIMAHSKQHHEAANGIDIFDQRVPFDSSAPRCRVEV